MIARRIRVLMIRAQDGRRLALPAVAVAAIWAIGGCGNSSGDGSQSAAGGVPTLTKAGFIAKADVICANTDNIQKEKLATYEAAHPRAVLVGPSGEKIVKSLLLPPIGIEIHEIRDLGAPTGTKKQLKPIFSGWENALKAAESNPNLIMVSEGPFTAPDKLARGFGFKDCAKAL